ncbi:MAG: nuclear transport factor 2 family protein [Gammaproteobacteria bacterium]
MTKKTPDELLAELLDREAIRDLPACYCDCVWRGDVDGLVELFTEEGAFVIRSSEGETRVEGRVALKEFYRVGLRHQQRPLIHNVVVELRAADRASGRAYLDIRSAKHNYELMGAGHYADEYRKLGGRWYFESRIFTAVRLDEGPGSAKTRSTAASAARRVRRAH